MHDAFQIVNRHTTAISLHIPLLLLLDTHVYHTCTSPTPTTHILTLTLSTLIMSVTTEGTTMLWLQVLHLGYCTNRGISCQHSNEVMGWLSPSGSTIVQVTDSSIQALCQPKRSPRLRLDPEPPHTSRLSTKAWPLSSSEMFS